MTTDAPVIDVVDDDESFRTSSAHRLLQTPSTMTPGCILLDVRMPGVSGPELQARLVAAGNPLLIVFLTGHGDIPTSVKAIKAGAEDFLSKPVSRKTLIAIQRAPVRYEEMRERSLRPTPAPAHSGHGLLDRIQQQTREEWLAQQCDASCLHRRLVCGLIIKGGDEYDRKAGTGCRQPMSQLDAGHPAQMNIQNEAGRLGCCVAGEKGLGRRKSFHIKAFCAKQTLKRFEHGRVVINHRDELSPGRHHTSQGSPGIAHQGLVRGLMTCEGHSATG